MEIVRLPSSSVYTDIHILSGYGATDSLIITNTASTVIKVIQSVVQPADGAKGYLVHPKESILVHYDGSRVWVRGGDGPVVIQKLSETITPFIGVDLPRDVYTSTKENIRRVRVDVAQTGFFDGRQFEFIKKFSSPVVYRFTCPIPFILQQQTLALIDGEVELFVWHSDNVTPSGVWTVDPTPIHRKNEVNTQYTGQLVVESGGTITVADSNLYRDYIVLKTANSSGQRTSVGEHQTDERYHNAGTYYVQLSGVGAGSYTISWEERPYGV